MMKHKLSRPVLIPLILGLLMVTVAPVISHKFQFSDGASGSLMGLGIGVQMLALIIGLKRKRMA